jgi:hypothetical protein
MLKRRMLAVSSTQKAQIMSETNQSDMGNAQTQARTTNESKPQYDATRGQLVCPYCGQDCGGWCEPGDDKYDSDDTEDN